MAKLFLFKSPDLIAASSFEPKYKLTQFITGHYRLNSLLYRIGKVPSSFCHCCQIFGNNGVAICLANFWQFLKFKLYEMYYSDFQSSISNWPSCFFSSTPDLITASSFEPKYKLTQFITGHYRLNSLLCRIGKVLSSFCHCCQISETCSNLLFKCPLNYTQRMFVSLCLSEVGLGFPFNLKLVVSNK